MTDHGAPRERDVRVLEVLLVEEKRELTKDEARRRWGLPERRFRAAVSEMRLRGYAVVSHSSEGSRYRMARSYAEVQEFVESEVRSRARVLEAQGHAMLARAAREYGEAKQQELVL